MGSWEKAFPADPVARIKTIREEMRGCEGRHKSERGYRKLGSIICKKSRPS